jgi:hypothetical protein
MLGGLLGGISGLVKFIIGWPLDLLKSAVTWIGEKMGFDMSFLKGFSFQDLIGDFYDKLTQGIIDGFAAIAEWFKGLPDKARSAVGKMGDWFSNLPEKFMQWIKGAVRAILPDPDSDSWFGWAAAKVIPDGIYEWAEYGKVPEEKTKAPGEEATETKGTTKPPKASNWYDEDGKLITDPDRIAAAEADKAFAEQGETQASKDFWADDDSDWDEMSPNAKTTSTETVTGGGEKVWKRDPNYKAAPKTAAEIAAIEKAAAEDKKETDLLLAEIAAANKQPIIVDQSVKSVNNQKKQVVVLKTRPQDQDSAQYGMKIG